MHMLWRVDAAMGRIDIDDKVAGGEALVNAIPPLRQSISTMKRPGGSGGWDPPPKIKDASNGPVASMWLSRSVTASCCG